MKMNTKVLGATALASGLFAVSSLAIASGPDILSTEPIFRSETVSTVETPAPVPVPAIAPIELEPESNFTVTFNGRTGLMLGFHTGDITAPAGVATAGSLTNTGLLNAPAATHTENDYWSMSTNYTRFGFTAAGDTALGPLTARLEGDFNGTNNNFRIRHAYGEVGSILAGQTWSLWNDGHPYISYWDWNGDALSPGNNIARRLQLRYSFEPVPGMKAAVAVEDPGAGTDTGFYDITANVQFQAGPAKITASALYTFDDKNTIFVPATTVLHDEEGFALAGSAQFDLEGMDATVMGVISDKSNAGFRGGIMDSRTASASIATTGFGAIWGAGGSLSGDLSDQVTWYAGGSYTSSSDIVDFEAIYGTGALAWSPMPQYTITGQVVYEQLNRPTAAIDSEAWSFLNYWIYKF